MSWKRVVALLFGATALSTLVALGFLTVRLHRVDRSAHAALRGEPRGPQGDWLQVARAMILPPEVRQFALDPHRERAVQPSSPPRPFLPFQTRCNWYGVASAKSPAWSRFRDRALSAARCEDLDELVSAARTSRFDLLRAESADELPPYLAVQAGLGSLIARARIRIEEHNWGAAEEDLRAVVTIGLRLQDSPSLDGLFLGNRALRAALDHLAVLHTSTGRTELAVTAGRSRDSILPPEACRGPIRTGFSAAGGVPEGLDGLASIAGDPREPLAVRVRAVTVIADGYLAHPREVLAGADRSRADVIRKVAEYPELLPWVAEAEAVLGRGLIARLRSASFW